MPQQTVSYINSVPSILREYQGDGFDDPDIIGTLINAHPNDVELVINSSLEDHGRSKWCWIRLSNGDLILGTFPQGDMYEEISQREGMV